MNQILADLTLSPDQIGLAAIAFIVTLLGYHAVVGKFIRQQAGVKETQTMEITGQPLNFQREKELVEKREHDEFKTSMKEQHDELWKVINSIRLSVSKIESSVAGLTALREANGDRLGEISHQVIELAKSVHTLTGVVQTKLKAAH